MAKKERTLLQIIEEGIMKLEEINSKPTPLIYNGRVHMLPKWAVTLIEQKDPDTWERIYLN